MKKTSFFSCILFLLILPLLIFPRLANAAPVNQELQASAFAGRDAQLFQDKIFSSLKRGTSHSQIERITHPFIREMATAMSKGEYDTGNRIKTYRPYEPIESINKRLKVGNYNRFENPTGVCFEPGDKAVLLVEGIKKDIPELRVRDFGKGGQDSSYPLKNGVNIIDIKNKGLGYISYFTDNFAKAPVIKIHIVTGKVNGVFDVAVNKAEEWGGILEKAPCEVLDIVGKYVHLIYPVKQLREFCPERGKDLIDIYDQLINYQHEMMGWEKYNCRPGNRMLGRVIWEGFMHADGWGAAFHFDTMNGLADPDKVKENAWGISHEFGHVNQVRPGMKWHGTAEVTNNLYSIWAQYQLNPSYINLEDHKKNDGEDNNVTGGRFNAFLNAALVNNEPWLFQKGPDKMEDYADGKGADHFVKLCPLWQLQLYFMVAGRGNPDFLPDIFQIVRKTDEERLTPGQLQINFMKNVCDVTKQDLSDFFVKTGMLRPSDVNMSDYGWKQFTITQADCDKLVRHARKYRKPSSPVIYYLSSKSVHAYTDGLAVEGKYGKGVEEQEHALLVSHDIWKNVTVFEAYDADGKLLRISMAGTGSPENLSTLAQYPEGSVRLEAVSWDGARTLVYGSRNN